MTFGESVKKCFSNYLNFDGRASRPEYWWFFLFYLGGSIFAGILDGILGGGMFFRVFFGISVLCPSIAVGVRRLHDTDRTGWWMLISFFPIIGTLVLLYFFLQNGTDGDNRFGPRPPNDRGEKYLNSPASKSGGR